MNENGSLRAVLAISVLLALPRTVLGQAQHPAALKPGHSAGVHTAQQAHTGLALIGTGAILAIVVVAATTNSGGGNNNNPVNQQASTTTTAP